MPFTNPNTHSMGGKQTAKNMTKEQRVERAKKANAAWQKAMQLKRQQNVKSGKAA